MLQSKKEYGFAFNGMWNMFSLLSQDIQNIIVFDLEWNQSGYNPNHRMPHEIIEIGACRVDRAGNVVSRFSELIRPRV